MIPFWKIKHDWWIEDFRFEIEQKWKIKLLLRQYPADYDLLDMIKAVDKKMGLLKKEYKKIYGDLPNLRKIKEEVEIEPRNTEERQHSD